ncbi:DUF362 domain-containing protein [candidate division CSSED10-310 bacterium]|uniref:DUF362 domain-containing protein n=1 Tax=candidate division CSSED10-310 bacterium TaxID=2855610 RepID=A0ABV6Z5P1_UNCC1
MAKKMPPGTLMPLHADLLKVMLDEGMKHLTRKNLDQAWRVFFHPSDRVGLKVNTLAGKGMSTHPELALALAACLHRGAGLKPKNIIIWDRECDELKRAGYPLKTAGHDFKCFGTDHQRAGFTKDLAIKGSVCSLLSSIFTDLTDLTVNLPVLKDHNLAGLSGGLKNMFGIIHNPNKYHDNNCDPFVADLNSLPVVKKRLTLTIADAIKIQYEGGPGYQPRYTLPYNAIVLGDDPVAVDMVLLKIIDEQRVKKGLPPLFQTDRPPRHITRAGNDAYRLGAANMNKIEVIEGEV